jgi:threonyl-tRNA synthetase
MGAVASDRARLPLSADLLQLCDGRDPRPWRLGRRLDGDGAAMPLRAVGRIGLGPGAIEQAPRAVVCAVAAWRLEARLSLRSRTSRANFRSCAGGEYLMPNLTFPDGAVRPYPDNATPLAVAESISKGLAKKAVAAKVDGQWWDLNRPLENDSRFELVTRDTPDGLEVLRHDAAHVLAQAVQDLFPGTQVTIGPTVEDGFYYDFFRAEKFSTDDFEKIEKRMREIVDADLPIQREVWNREEAIAHFKEIGESFKAQIIDDIIPPGEPITVYRQGNDWKDLCRGPHLPSTGRLGKAFKLMKLAGAYWRGDPKNPQLQRIYGTAWADEKQLAEHLHRLEEAEKRDHRKIGRALDLFHMQEEGRGMVFWHDKGWTLWRTLEAYIRRRLDAAGYVEVKTPQVLDRVFWEKSGHWEKYRENMFVCETVEEETLSLKPMNCPGHVQIFKFGQRSYRELPIRMAEFGACHRYEPSGLAARPDAGARLHAG